MENIIFFWNWYKPIAGWVGGIIFTLLWIICLNIYVRYLTKKARCPKCQKLDFGLALGFSYRCRHCNW
ncbi:MAG: hypothetical protein WAV16_02985 [Candidatus Moraniibacteriota bacterium]